MLYTKWPTAASPRNKSGRFAVKLLLAAVCLALAGGCSMLPQEEEPEKLPPIRVPKISQKSEYPVKRSTLEIQASGSGKLMSEREDPLYFTEENRRIVDVRVKAGDKVKKGQLLALLDTGDTESQIRRREIELEKAELDLKTAMRDAGEDPGVELRKQQLDYELLQEELAELRLSLVGASLTAPYAGTIVSFTAEKGDMAKAYGKIGQIADLDALVVAVQFASADLASIAPGMDAIVSINAAGDVGGTVRRLPVDSDQAGSEQDSLAARVLIDVPQLPDGAGHDTPLSAAVIVERRESVLSIPVAALRKQNSRSYVIVSNPDGSKGEVDVEIGIQTSTDVEVIRGLQEGQKVVGK